MGINGKWWKKAEEWGKRIISCNSAVNYITNYPNELMDDYQLHYPTVIV